MLAFCEALRSQEICKQVSIDSISGHTLEHGLPQKGKALESYVPESYAKTLLINLPFPSFLRFRCCSFIQGFLIHDGVAWETLRPILEKHAQDRSLRQSAQ